MLQFILGKSGTGKTKYLYENIKKQLETDSDKIIMLVPDSNTFETEKALLELLGPAQFRKVNVFGFQRMCRRVFELMHMRFDSVLDNGTRAMIMSVVLESLTEKLTLLKAKNNRSMTDLMLQTLTESKNSGVTPEMLRNAADRVKDETLKTKLLETALVFEAYNAQLSQSLIDPLDDLERLIHILTDHTSLYEDYTLYIDAFSGFKAQQLRVISLLLDRCRDIFISLTLDPEVSKKEYIEDVFATTRATYQRLMKIAGEDLSLDIEEPVKLCDCMRFGVNEELKSLESRIFRVKNAPTPCEAAPHHISIYAASDTYNECEYIARQIKKLVIREHYLYSDISVICHDTDEFDGILNVVFEKYEIPYFMDCKRTLDVKPVVRFINAVFRIVIDHFEREDVLMLLKSGLTVNAPDDISIFENYVLKWNINNSAFKTRFTQNPRGFSHTMTDADTYHLGVAERVRASVVEPLLSFQEAVKDKNGREISTLLHELILHLGVPNALKTMYDSFKNISDRDFGAEQIKIYQLLMNALDKTVAVVGDTPLSISRYYELLSFQISAMELSEIPQLLDSVNVTTAQRMRASNRKAAFLIGCAEGQFPTEPHTSGLFSPFEIQLLSDENLELGENTAELVNLEKFMAYSCMTSVTDKLFISYHTLDLTGSQFKPSEIISQVLKKAYPNTPFFSSTDFSDAYDESMYALQPAFEEYAKSLSEEREELSGLREFFENTPEYSSKSAAVIRAIDKSDFKIESKDNAQLLFGANLDISASQIERFYQCPFSYFCNYGLNVQERKPAKIDTSETGNIVHYVLERYFTVHSDKAVYSAMGDSEIKAFIKKAAEEYLNNILGGADGKSEAFLFQLENIRQNIFIVLKHMIEELSQSEFEIVKCELCIPGDVDKYTIKLSNGQMISIRGKVDRVDIMEENGERYLRVIDYKTGKKGKESFKLSEIVYGINLQMLIYMYTIICTGQAEYSNLTSAGVLYAPAELDAVSDKELSGNELDTEIKKALKMKGVILDRENVILGMDKTDAGTYIPVAVKPNRDAESRLSHDEFNDIFRHIEFTVRKMGAKLYGGEIEAVPLKGMVDGCEYCKFDSVCAYRKNREHKADKLKKDEVFKKIGIELGDIEAEDKKDGDKNA